MKIFLIGFMGCGKTYWGRLWARHLQLDFFDLDAVIEQREQKTIASIFAEEGETRFREIESEVLRDFYAFQNCIIACGGGTACFNDNIDWMNKNGTVVYLEASPEYILQRVANSKAKRPLIKDVHDKNLLSFITEKLAGRELFYKKASVIMDVEQAHLNSLPALLYHKS